ncbi:MAG TPA: hypothetical protein VJX92_04075 [Methylomirabilota bacterium]|nr:hypothetical protein [Methylomirabilota bacterium]
MRSARPLVLALLVVGLSGCLSIKSYVDPRLPTVGYRDLLSARDPQPLALTVAFHRNGSPASLGVSRARDEVRAVVERSKLFSAVVTEKSTAPGSQLDIVLDNVGDLNDAAAKGAKTGLTFGASGSQVTDGYVFTATFRPAGKAPVTKVYHHAMHSTIGNAPGPTGIEPMSVGEAFNKVVEGLVLNLLLDLQKEELL